jgi:hypothetical protein
MVSDYVTGVIAHRRGAIPKAILKVEQAGSPDAAVDSRGGEPWWSAGRRSAPEAGGFRKGIVCGARRARSASGWQHPSAWRGHDPGASRRSIFGLGVTSREDDSDANRIARMLPHVIAALTRQSR